MKLQTEKWDKDKLIVNTAFAEILRKNKLETVSALWHSNTESVKEIIEERGTGRLFLQQTHGLQPMECYLKRYRPPTLKERLKNWVYGKGCYDALHEWKAIVEFNRLGISTMLPIAVGKSEGNSCILTAGIKNYSRASILLPALHDNKQEERRHRVISRIAKMLGTMHKFGFAHQDFYLVHIFIKEAENDKPYIIDLQRVIMQRQLAQRWRVKDIAQLLFSASGMIDKNDIKIFWGIYLRTAEIKNDPKLCKKIYKKAGSIAARHNRKTKATTCNGKVPIPSLPCP